MTLTQAFVICFVVYMVYKLMQPSGLPKEMVDKLTKEISINVANVFKRSALENKLTLAKLRNDLHSGDSERVESAINQIEAIFDKDIQDANDVIEHFRKKQEDASTGTQSNK